MSHKKSKGDILRQAFEDARSYEHRSEIQLEELNKRFRDCVNTLTDLIGDLEDNMNLVDLFTSDDRSEWLIKENIEKRVFDKYIDFLEIDTTLTDYTAEQVCALPNYIRLHEIARRADIALKLIGIVKESSEESENSQESILLIDISQGYEDGRDDLYPELPPLPPSLDRQSRSYDLKR